MLTTDKPNRTLTSPNPQGLAWITMLGGLVVFVMLCIGSVVFARWLVFESPTGMNVMLHVGQGTVGLQAPDSSDERAVRGSAEVENDDRMSTDNLSQGYLAFSDPYSGDIIATVMLRNNSTATLGTANRPRFEVSDNAYSMQVHNVVGNIEVWVSDGIERDIRLDIETGLGTLHIEEKGHFLIETTPTELTVMARDGNATLYGPDGSTQPLTPEITANVVLGGQEIALEPGPLDLLTYSTFGTDWANEWICAHQPDALYPNAPGGDIEYGTEDGRPMIRLWRYNSGPTPAKTGCFQRLGENGDGLDVMGYEGVHLRVTMQVKHQSLSACGIAGTECAIMLKMTYLDQAGNTRSRVWYHGFYSDYRPSETSRRICDSCWEPHEQVNRDAWYTYESGDILNDWPVDLRVGLIQEIEFYASGHEYDVMLNEVALLATLPEE